MIDDGMPVPGVSEVTQSNAGVRSVEHDPEVLSEAALEPLPKKKSKKRGNESWSGTANDWAKKTEDSSWGVFTGTED